VRRNKSYGYFISLSYFDDVNLIDNEVVYSDIFESGFCWS